MQETLLGTAFSRGINFSVVRRLVLSLRKRVCVLIRYKHHAHIFCVSFGSGSSIGG